MVQMKVFAGTEMQLWRTDTWRGARNWDLRTDTYTLLCVKQPLVGTCPKAQEAQLSSVVTRRAGEGDMRGREGVCVRIEQIRFIMQQKLTQQHHMVDQLFANKKNKICRIYSWLWGGIRS